MVQAVRGLASDHHQLDTIADGVHAKPKHVDTVRGATTFAVADQDGLVGEQDASAVSVTGDVEGNRIAPTTSWFTADPDTQAVPDRHGLTQVRESELLPASGNEPLLLPRQSPNMNAFVERFFRSLKSERPGRLILFGGMGQSAGP